MNDPNDRLAQVEARPPAGAHHPQAGRRAQAVAGRRHQVDLGGVPSGPVRADGHPVDGRRADDVPHPADRC